MEREEKERIEAARRRELERIARRAKEDAEREANAGGGVRFKGTSSRSLFVSSELTFCHCCPLGRGKMKYVDPELNHSRR